MRERQAIATDAALSAFNFGAQQNRLICLKFPLGDGPEAILLPNRMSAHEEISRCFRYEVELLSDDARIPLKAMMAKMVTISLVREDGSLRYFNGYVIEFRFLRADGVFAFYQMVLEPWLAFTKLRKDNVSFHGKSVVELTELTFAHYRQADWQLHIVDDDPRLTCANQYDETDYNHLHRRWEALGLMYSYEHRADGHTLWLYDKSTLAQPIDPTGSDDSGEIPFRDKAGSLEDDGICEWSPVRRIGSGQTTLASFDDKNPVAQRASAESPNNQGDIFQYEVYENTGSYGFRPHASIRQTFRLFVQKAGMKLIAASGDIEVKALTDNTNLLAKLNITQTASRIVLSVEEDIVINGGGSYVKFSAGEIEHGTNGSFIAHAANHDFVAAKTWPCLTSTAMWPTSRSSEICTWNTLTPTAILYNTTWS